MSLMDFLDPEYKKRHSIILIIGQGLVGLAVIIAAILLVLKAYGFDLDRKTGKVVQNGLVYVDSAPDKADITINGKAHQDRTNTRFTLPAGGYSVELNKSDYRTWKKQFELEGSAVERFTYPMLVPKDLKTKSIDSGANLGYLFSQSPDRKWVVASDSPDLATMKEYNLSDLTNTQAPKIRTFTIPSGVLEKSSTSKFEVVDWSNNNASFLVRHTFDGKIEYALLNRDEPAKSLNLKSVGYSAGEVLLLDKSAEKFIVHNKTDGSLFVIDSKAKKNFQLLSGVLSYKSHGDNKIIYSHVSPTDKSKARVTLLDGDKSYDIREIPLSDNMPLDIASFQDKWYIAVGSEKEGKTYLYENFVSKYKQDPLGKVSPIRVLKSNITSPLKIGFSKNVRFIASFSGDDVSVYDIEDKRSYRYKLNMQFPAGDYPLWMDGHRLSVSSGGNAVIVEFDGANPQTLTAASSNKNIFFDRDYERYYVFDKSSDPAKFEVKEINLRTDQDL